MAEKKINNTVLIAPLDWGLGHATRCIPIIKKLLQKKCRIIIATDGAHKILLQQVFPELEFFKLPGYGIKYSKKFVLVALAKQLPRFLKTIKAEHKWLEKIISDENVQLVISDNRYGLWSKKIPCVFITHQLQLQVPFFMKWAQAVIQKRLYRLIEKFSICWIPDVADFATNISGKLGHPNKLPNIPVQYIGPLSRFENPASLPKKYALMFCLSGPEPQRTLFENILLPQFKKITGKILLVRGKPGSDEILSPQNNVSIVNHLPTMQMQQAFEHSNFIISRCGYSTLMDMQVLGCKCIYVPTPGQTEQEYLGKLMKDKGNGVVFKQDGFSLEEAIKTAQTFDYKPIAMEKNDRLEDTITDLLTTIAN